MAQLIQVGAGSGGMPVLDLLCRDPRLHKVTLIEPDVYKPHNVERHPFPPAAVGEPKAELAQRWLRERRPDLEVELLECDLLAPSTQAAIEDAARSATVGVCAADNEAAKFHFDSVMRRCGKPWTLGEVLSGGIGGFVHWFAAGGPCYGCVASHLKRAVTVDKPKAPDYSQPGGPVLETTIPASMASIHAIASLHALVTLDLLTHGPAYDPGFTSLLLTLQRVPDVFDEPFKPYKFRIPRLDDCLICAARPAFDDAPAEQIDEALDRALARLGGSEAMHQCYEKGGLVVADQPIAWNADAVVVECLARLPGVSARCKDDLLLRIPGREPVPLDNLRRDDASERCRLFFRFPPPPQTTNAEVIWRHHRLGEMTLPVLSRGEFLKKLTLQTPTLAVRLGELTVACQTFVTTQCRGVLASALLASPTSLAPLLDLDFRVELHLEGEPSGAATPAKLSNSQLQGKQALVTASLVKLPKRTGHYVASWRIDDDVLATQKIKAISKSQFSRSLRLSDTRLVVQSPARAVSLARQLPPAESAARLGPCFLVSSGEIGMAALCPLSVRARLADGMQTAVLLEQELLVTDGPTAFVPGTLDAAEVFQMQAFELCAGARTLGVLPLASAPVAAFDGEGGFQAPPEYVWSRAAEEQLQEKLAHLLQPKANGR